MKNVKCGLSNAALCVIAVSVLGLVGTAVILASAAAKKRCSGKRSCAERNADQETKQETK